jgi:hypothetical protein
MTDKFEDEFEFPDEKEAKEAKKQAAAEDDKFEVEIEDDTPPADRGRKAAPPPEDPTDDELNSYDEKVQARIKKFTRGYHDERRAKEEALRERQAAEAYAKQVYEENKRLQQQLASGSQVFIEQSKSTADIELTVAKKAYRDAVEAGDIDAQADAQADIARAMLKVDKAQGMKPIEVEEKDDFKPAQPVQDDQPRMSPRTKKWVDANSDWWGVDEEMTMTAMGLDKKLAKEYGSDYVGTEEYFKTIDKTMRKRFPEHFDSEQSHEDDDTPPQKTSEPAEEETPRRATKPATVVAPASRSTPPNRIRLKASEAAIARRLGVPIEQYAKQVALLKRGE